MDAITLNNAAFAYANRQIFENASFSIKQGAVFCLLGPNGCGKTTFIDCLLNIHPLTCGDIFISGVNIKSMPARQIARHLAYIPQKHDRHFSFTVTDILLMGRCTHTSFFSAPGPEDRDRVRHVLESFGMCHLADRDYTRLSGGESQLVMIMRALVQDTPVIVMDEPTAHLDFRHELQVLETIIRMVRQENKTLVMATHFPNHAFYLENQGIDVHVAFLHEKKIRPSGLPSQALTRESLALYYGIDTCIISQDLPENGMIKQIIPIRTRKDHP